MALLHRMQPARRDFMRQYLPEGSLRGLDVGCGGGINTIDMARLGHSMLGLDSEKELIAVAEKEASEQHLIIDWHCQKIEDFAPQELFDFICCYEVLEHLENPELACQFMLRWLKPGGLIFCSTLNKTLLSYVVAIGLGEYLLRALPIGTHEFEKFIPPQKMHAMLRPAICQELRGLIYNPLEKTFFLGETTCVQYIAVWWKS